ncbi:hypothetical protein AB0I60_00155 [Actinosynnema sp. NPDC050436]|uniref:hypothetical protein n=1 Tax=Actinosynnema sp. NPDC050436 TaxID=3155659 RepID=UPI0033C71A2F
MSGDVVTCSVDGSVRAHVFPGGHVVDFPVEAGVRPVRHAAARDLGRAAYVTGDELVAVDRTGAVLWRYGFGPVVRARYSAEGACAFSPDGGSVWLYLPDAMAGRGDGGDRWLVLDAATGEVRAQAALDSEGHGGRHFPHPDGVHVLLDVGEGQDGVRVYRGRLDGTAPGGSLDLHAYPWGDRILLGVAPDGHRFLTADHAQEDVALHTFPDGEVVARLAVDDFGHDPGEVFVEWSGGFLDAATAVVALVGETDGEDWTRYHLVDVEGGQPLGVLDTPPDGSEGIRPLGDGSWLTFDPAGRPTHHREAVR